MAFRFLVFLRAVSAVCVCRNHFEGEWISDLDIRVLGIRLLTLWVFWFLGFRGPPNRPMGEFLGFRRHLTGHVVEFVQQTNEYV